MDTGSTESDPIRKQLADTDVQQNKNETGTQDEIQIQKIQTFIASNPESSDVIDDSANGAIKSEGQSCASIVLQQQADVRNSNNSIPDDEPNNPSNPFSSDSKDVDQKETVESKNETKLDTSTSPVDHESKTTAPEDNHEQSKITTQQQSLNCTICFKSFSKKNYLTIHMKSHGHKKPKPQEKASLPNPTLQKQFQCTICPKIFHAAQNLKLHQRTHTGEKPYKCTICSKTFTQPHSLKSHIRIHTGERPYECPECGKSFAHYTNFKVHVRSHTGERRHNCFMCEKRYSVKSALDAHLRTHDPKRI